MQKARMIFAALTLALGAAAMSGCALLGLDAADELDPTPRIQTHASAIWNEYQKVFCIGCWVVGGGRHPNSPGRVADALSFSHSTSIRLLFTPVI